MSEFEAVLRSQVDEARQRLIAAKRAVDEHEADGYRARIGDLVDVAERHGLELGGGLDSMDSESA